VAFSDGATFLATDNVDNADAPIWRLPHIPTALLASTRPGEIAAAAPACVFLHWRKTA